MEGDIVGCGKFTILKRIYKGPVSEIFEGVVTGTDEKVAIKRAHVSTDNQLSNESDMYKRLHEKDNDGWLLDLKDEGVGIPSYKWSGVDGEYMYLVIELLGKSLKDHLEDLGDFSLKTVLMLADRIIDTVRYMHSKKVIHRDIKPEHLLMGVGSNVSKVYLIDFGLAKLYIDPALKQHIRYREGLGFVGTDIYASIYTHLGFEQSRRDDGMTLCYVFMYLLNGCLPWQGVKRGDDKQKYLEDLCKYKDYFTEPEELKKFGPLEFATCLKYTRVAFNDTPYLSRMQTTLRELSESEGYTYDFIYDWTRGSEEKDVTKMETSSKNPKRTLDTQDSSSDMISDDVSSLEDVLILWIHSNQGLGDLTFIAGNVTQMNMSRVKEQLDSFQKSFIYKMSHQNVGPTNSHHRLCTWHITSKLSNKVSSATCHAKDFKQKFNELVWNSRNMLYLVQV